MITMKGAAVSAKLKEQVEKGLETLTWVPKLTIIRVGENPDDISYEKGATKKLTSFGLEVESHTLPLPRQMRQTLISMPSWKVQTGFTGQVSLPPSPTRPPS